MIEYNQMMNISKNEIGNMCIKNHYLLTTKMTGVFKLEK